MASKGNTLTKEKIKSLKLIIKKQKYVLKYIIDNNDGNYIVLGDEAVNMIERILKLDYGDK